MTFLGIQPGEQVTLGAGPKEGQEIKEEVGLGKASKSFSYVSLSSHAHLVRRLGKHTSTLRCTTPCLSLLVPNQQCCLVHT